MMLKEKEEAFASLLEGKFKASGFNLEAEQIQKFVIYKRELKLWNQRINLTSITDDLEIIEKHFLESVELLRHFDLELKSQMKLADVGSGGGFPGLPIKICVSEVHMTLIEASQKRAAFLRNLAKILGLSGLEVIENRAEALAKKEEYREKYDLVLSRYVAQLPTLVEYSLPLVKIGGFFIAYKYGEISEEIAMANRAIQVLGGRLHNITELVLQLNEPKRRLLFISKIEPTPQKYPRTTGAAKKRPIQ